MAEVKETAVVVDKKVGVPCASHTARLRRGAGD
jgi:hypothetical protein